MSDLEVGELAALATALLWTVSSLIWTSTGKRIGALAVNFIRIVIACSLLMGYGQVVRGLCLPIDATARTWLLLGASGFLWSFLSDLCLLKAFLLIGPRLSLLILSLTPPMAAALSWVCIGDELAAWRWVAMGVTLTGVAWVVFEQPNGDAPSHTRRHWGRGVILAVLAATLQAFALVLSKEGIGNYDPVAAALIAMLGALFGHIVLVTLWRRWPAMLAAVRHGRTMVILIFGAIVGPGAGAAFNMVALRHAPAGVVATIVATMPVLILPFSILLYREKVSLRAVVGAIIAVVGVALLTVHCWGVS